MATESSKEEAPKASEASTTNSAAKSASGIGIAALVVGIVAILSGWAPVWGLIVGAAAIVLGIVALKKSKANKGFGITGIVLGAIGALASIIVTAFWVLALTAVTIGGTAAIKASQAATSALSAQDAAAQKEIDSQKDFPKGSTATFGTSNQGTFTVKVNSVNLNYVPDNTYEQAASGSKYVVVNVTVTNTGSSSVDVTSSDLELNADGVANTTSYITSVDPAFSGGSLDKGASSTGNLVYSVPTSASTLKLQYTATVVTISPYQLKTLTYTLAL